MIAISRALAGSLAAGALAISAATPAFARDDFGRGYDRGGFGDGRGWHDDRGNGWGRGHGHGFGGRDNSRRAAEQCVRTAEREASRNSYGRADVTDVRDIRETRYGFEVRGRIAVNGMGRDWRDGDNRYGRGWNNDYRGWNDNLRGYDSGSFKCTVERGRVVDLDFSGIRGL